MKSVIAGCVKGRPGGWVSSDRDEEAMRANEGHAPVSPTIVNNNLAQADPALPSFDDAKTSFHEFDHGAHGLLSRVRCPVQSGTNARRYFVEQPSQLLEHLMGLPDTARRYCRHPGPRPSTTDMPRHPQ